MLIRGAIATVISIGLLAGCATTGTMSTMGPIETRLTGKTLVNSGGWSITPEAGGVLSGTEADGSAVVGTWEERNGQFCRTLTQPADWAGTACQNVVFEDDGTVTFIRADGSKSVMTMQ
ncbi:hypothetical protein [Roseivivax sp. THAF30]|uniref:hypothetical protein n=1 Tax=Roseivivax sp. THAF30 TaxID=2587852 RepID=UPI00126884CE|nr:hypothetical protein [Roseivivax sp. THAF30]QFT62065.1 hypothetical protein FIU91_03915 [Roseivivax sp. THAF30]